MGGEVSEYVIILVCVKDTTGVDERDPSVADAVIVSIMDKVIIEEVDLEKLTLELGLNEFIGLAEKLSGNVAEIDKEVIGVNDIVWLTEEESEFIIVLVRVERGELDILDRPERVWVIIEVPDEVIWYELEYWLDGEDERDTNEELELDELITGVREFDKEVDVVCE